ncbi:MAG: hypothetical protein QM820_16825 [Minicystis sp.]
MASRSFVALPKIPLSIAPSAAGTWPGSSCRTASKCSAATSASSAASSSESAGRRAASRKPKPQWKRISTLSGASAAACS